MGAGAIHLLAAANVSTDASAWSDYVTAIATAVAAVGTVGAVLVALFYQPLRERRRRPLLSILPPRNFTREMPGSSYQLEAQTFKVSAAKGRKSAEEVEVLATVRWRSARPDAAWHLQFDNRPLPWYSSDDVEGNLERMHLAPGVTRRVEFLKVGAPEALYEWLDWPIPGGDSYLSSGAVVALSPPPRPKIPGSHPFVHDHLDWKLRLDLTAKDVDTRTYEVDLKVVVEWYPESLNVLRGEPVDTAPEMWLGLADHRFSASLQWSNFREVF